MDRTGLLNLQFYVYYNCYQKKSIIDFFRSDCSDVKDRLTIYSKSSSNSLYSVVRQYDLVKANSTDNWKLFNLDLNSTSTTLYVIYTFLNAKAICLSLFYFFKLKVKFERVIGASRGEALFGLDGLALIGNFLQLNFILFYFKVNF